MIVTSKIWLFLILSIPLIMPLSAQEYSYVQYNAASGAPFDQVRSVVHDEEGYLWIGSHNGLYRFDGESFENLGIHIKSQHIHQLILKKNKIFFVNDTGLHQISNLTNSPNVSAILEGGIIENEQLPFYPNDLFLSKDGTAWLSQSNHSIGKLQHGQFKTYSFSKTEKPQKITIAEDNAGQIWALSPLDGLFLYHTEKDRFEKKLSMSNGQTLFIQNQQLLIGGDALYIYTFQNNQPRLRRTIPLKNDQVTCISSHLKNQLLIGTQNGKLYLLPDTKSTLATIYGSNESHRIEELNFGKINQIYSSPDSVFQKRMLWVSSQNGLWLLKQTMFETVTKLPKNNPISISFNSKGTGYVPMNTLYEISLVENDFVARPINKDDKVTAVTTDRADELWISTAWPKCELIKYHSAGKSRTYSFADRGEDIFNLFSDSKKNLWFCQAPHNKPIIGVGKINADGTVQFYDEQKGFSSRVLVVKESSRGEIYAAGIGDDSYLYRYDAQKDRFINLSLPLPFTTYHNFEVHDLTIDDRGVVWLATTDGLLRYDSENITLIQNDILKQEEIRGVTHVGKDKIWAATATNGLVFHRNSTSVQLGEQAGLPAVISAYRCIEADKDGRIWAGTMEGLVYSRTPDATLPLSNQPKIKSVLVDGIPPPKDSLRFIKINERSQLTLAFTNLFFPAKNIEYQYRLTPASEKDILLKEHLWEPSQNGNIIKFSEVTPGDYMLEVRAKQPGGYQWSPPLEMHLKFYKYWFLQSWFLYPAGLALLLLSGYYLRLFMQRRINKLQKVLNFVQQRLAKRESELNQKILEFDEQKAELANATSNIHTLELFIQSIPKEPTWNDIITAMARAVDQETDIDAFEISFIEKGEVVHRGYSNQEKGGYTFRSKPFDPKTSLTSWAIANHQEVVINDFDKEHVQYIARKEAYHFQSLIFIPFHLKNNQSAALCAYNIHKNQFDHNDLIMFRILSRFIILSAAHQQIKKTNIP